MSTDNQLLIEIAHLYYDNDWTQERIASEFNMSRSLVSKSLTKAKKLGIVEVIVHDEHVRPHRELELKLKEKFDLKEVLCLNTVGKHGNKDAFAKAAGAFLSNKIVRSNKVVIASGSGNYNIAIHYTSSSPLQHVTFIPASGGLYEDQWETQANVICERIAHNCGAHYMRLHVPIVVDSLEAKEVLMKQHFVNHVFSTAEKADLAIVGIGASPEYHKLSEAHLNGLDSNRELTGKSLTGDIAYHYFDKKGQLIDCEWNRQLMAISLESLKKIPEVVGIAHGKQKTIGIYTAAKYHLIDTLITDEETGKELLSFKE